MNNTDEIIQQYNLLLKEDIANIIQTIKESSASAKLYGNLVLKHPEVYNRNKITDYIRDTLVNNKKFNYTKAYRLFAKDNIKNYIPGTIQDDDSRMVRAYFYHFKEAALLWSKSTKQLKELELQHINDKTIKYLYRQYNWHMGSEMLTNGIYYPIGGNFRLRVAYKHRANRLRVGKSRQKVDWGASFKLLLVLLKDLNPELLELYKSKIIRKADLIDRSKPLLFNSLDNPKGAKWLVYDDKDFDFWLILKTYDSNNPNKMFYGVTPVNYVENITRRQSDFINDVTHIDDIIFSKALGFRDKIFMLEKFNIGHCLNTFKDDI